jgi:hypothetical protein
MVRENTDRNVVVYELWKKGCTIDEIAFETAIPRSTVGYYVRKFNKRAKSGEPIVFQQVREPPDEKVMAVQAFIKSSTFFNLLKMLENGEIDKVYKMLMILKLSKELQRDIFPTKEEGEAFLKNLGYVFDQISLANKLTST